MSNDDFANYGLEPGQRALLWDAEQKKYVAVSKPAHPWTVLVRLLAMAAPVAAVHGLAAIALLGGFTS